MGNDWLADAWGDNPLSDPAISDAEKFLILQRTKPQDSLIGIPPHTDTWKTNPTPILHPIVLPHRARSHAHEREGRQLNMMQNPVHKTLRQNPQQSVHRAPVRSVETRTGKRIPAPQEHRKIALCPGYWGSSCRGRTSRKSTKEETVIRPIIS